MQLKSCGPPVVSVRGIVIFNQRENPLNEYEMGKETGKINNNDNNNAGGKEVLHQELCKGSQGD